MTSGQHAVGALSLLAFDLYGRQRRYMMLRAVRILLFQHGTALALVLIRLAQHFNRPGRRFLAVHCTRRLRREFGCFIQPTAEIGPGLKLPHPNGIVIGLGARIGASCIIYHQVTLGGARRGDYEGNNYPAIGDRVTLFAGAKVIGAVSVGDDAVVGANAVVNRDVPARHAAVGVPAQNRPLRRAED